MAIDLEAVRACECGEVVHVGQVQPPALGLDRLPFQAEFRGQRRAFTQEGVLEGGITRKAVEANGGAVEESSLAGEFLERRAGRCLRPTSDVCEKASRSCQETPAGDRGAR